MNPYAESDKVGPPKKFMMVRKIHRENDRMSEDPSLSENEAL